MDIQELEKERDAYAQKIGKLALYIALIFAIPVIIAILITRYFDIAIWWTLGASFIVSWFFVIRFYRKVDRKVRTLEEKIRTLKQAEEHSHSHEE